MYGLLEDLGLEDMVDHGEEIGARCPGHPTREDHPRHWFINKVNNRHHCFACGYKGSITTLVMDQTDLDMWEAIRYIREHGVDIAALTSFDAPVEVEIPERATLDEKYRAFSAPPDRALRHRKISAETAQKFGIRWDAELNEWILPIHGPDGDLWGWQRKSNDYVLVYPNRTKKKETLFGYCNGTGGIIVVESPLDVAYLNELGHEAVAIYGSHMSTQQVRLLLNNYSTLILALDNDDAGINETRRLLDDGITKRIPTYVINYGNLPKGIDPGAMTQVEVDAALKRSIFAPYWNG